MVQRILAFGRKRSFDNRKQEDKTRHADLVAKNNTSSCPICGSKRTWKDGLKYFANGVSAQRRICRDCGHRFGPMKFMDNHENEGQYDQSLIGPLSKVAFSQIGVSLPKGVTNLVRTAEANYGPAGATTPSDTESRGQIVAHMWWMKKEGYADNTITRRAKLLTTLVKRGAQLLSPESVKETIARQEKWNPKTRELAVEAYSCFLRMSGLTWRPPRFMKVEKLPFIPTGEEVNQLIAGSNKKVSTFLQLLMETGMRSGEAWNLKWTDFDFERKQTRVVPEKGGKPRALKISDRLIAMLMSLPTRSTCQKPFEGSLRHFARNFRANRARTAQKLGSQRIKQITFCTLRHWKATMEYHKTRDILHVKEMLGHRSIQSTLIYTQLINFEDDDFNSATAKNVEEAQKLVEAGFEYVCDFDNIKLFRKRK